jgi:hypothetical protein
MPIEKLHVARGVSLHIAVEVADQLIIVVLLLLQCRLLEIEQ